MKKRIGFLVRNEVAERLERLAAHTGGSMTGVLEELVMKAPIKRGRIPKKKKAS